MPRYVVDFTADIEELNENSLRQVGDNYSESEIKKTNNVSETAMGNVQCLFTVGEMPQQRRIVVSRGIQCDHKLLPQLTSIRHENICSVSGYFSSEYNSNYTQPSANSSLQSSSPRGQQEELIMGRIPNDQSLQKPPELKENVLLKNKREQLLHNLQIDTKDDDPDSLSDTLSDLMLNLELRDQVQKGFKHFDEKKTDRDYQSDVHILQRENTSENVADVVVVDPLDGDNNGKDDKMKWKSSLSSKMTEKGDGITKGKLKSKYKERYPHLNEVVAINQSNFTNERDCSRYERYQSHDIQSPYPNETNIGNNVIDKFPNYRKNSGVISSTTTSPLVNLPPKPPRPQSSYQIERPSKNLPLRASRNQSNVIKSVLSPESIDDDIESDHGDIDEVNLRQLGGCFPPGTPVNDHPYSERRTRLFTDPKLMSPRGYYYPSRIPQPVTHKFYVSESDGIGDILADSTDRRIKAICDRHRCDIAVYSPIIRGGYRKYIVMLTAPSASEMKKCVRSLDTTLKWNLSSQLK